MMEIIHLKEVVTFSNDSNLATAVDNTGTTRGYRSRPSANRAHPWWTRVDNKNNRNEITYEW